MVDIADHLVLSFMFVGVAVDEGRINGLELGILLDVDALIPQDHPALPLGRLQVNILRIMHDLSE